MPSRVVVACVVSLVLVLGVATVFTAETVQPATVSALAVPTYKAFIPVISRCYPKPSVDPSFGLQGDMSRINADDAWTNCWGGNNSVTVAIIDTGADLDHPELVANAWWGYDYVDGDWVPQDGEGHGTNVAGIVGAPLNGNTVSGVAPNVRLLIVRVLDDNGSGFLSDVANGVIHSSQMGAKVLNLSLGGTSNSQTLADAINYATGAGRLVIAAAGNCGDAYYWLNGCSSMNQTLYPGAYANVLAVAATNNSDGHASFSNVGSYVDMSAPGVDIYNLTLNGYTYLDGTSQAAPHVAGLAALVWTYNTGYNATTVWNRMASTAVNLGTAGWDSTYGWGRIDVKAALGFTALAADVNAAGPDRIELPPAVTDRAAEIAAGRVIVKFKTDARATALDRTLRDLKGASFSHTIPAIDAHVLTVKAGEEWAVVAQLRAQADVLYAEPDFVMRKQ